MRETQKTKLLRRWFTEQCNNPNRFFYPYEFINNAGVFIGYKAPARFSELCVSYPTMVDSHMEGKYRVGRLRIDNTKEFLLDTTIPSELKTIVTLGLIEAGIKYTVYEQVPIFDHERNTVRLEQREKIIDPLHNS